MNILCGYGFNEAPSVKRGKSSLDGETFVIPDRFNEAPSVKRGKFLVPLCFGEYHAASMRPPR